MLRIRLEGSDLRRVTFSVAEHAETVGSLQTLRTPTSSPFLERWRQHALARLGNDAAALLNVVPASGFLPDFLTPERVSALPTAEAVRAGGGAELARLAPEFVAYHGRCLAGILPGVLRVLHADLAHRGQLLMDHGLDAVLDDLGELVRWRPPYLEIEGLPGGTVQLGGRGLRLVPVVLWTRPYVAVDGFRVPTVGFPIGIDARWREADAIASYDATLRQLLGATRARLLEAAAAGGGSTTGLAERVGVSASTASEHLAVLRRSGMIGTRRDGQGVWHVPTGLGFRLVRECAGVGGVSARAASARAERHQRLT